MSESTGPEDLFVTAGVLEHPYAYYDELRQSNPVYFSAALNAFLVTSYEGIKSVLTRTDVFSSDPRSIPMSNNGWLVFHPRYRYLYEQAGVIQPVETLVITDRPAAARYRRLVEAALSGTSVKKMDDWICGVVNELIDAFIDDPSGRVDLYKEICMKLPLYIINRALGLPRTTAALQAAGADATVRLSGAQMETPESVIQLHLAQIAFIKVLQPYINEYRSAPKDNLFSHIVNATVEGEASLSDAEILSAIFMLNVGGNETTTNGLGNSLYLLLRDADVQRKLRANLQAIPAFVEEAIRVETPVAGVFRWALHDAQICGVKIPKGSVVHARLGAGNRDSAAFSCPASIDLNRERKNGHLSFGRGIHFCVGSQLARAELYKAVQILLERTVELKFDVSAPAPKFVIKIPVRGVDRLPVCFKKSPEPVRLVST